MLRLQTPDQEDLRLAESVDCVDLGMRNLVLHPQICFVPLFDSNVFLA